MNLNGFQRQSSLGDCSCFSSMPEKLSNNRKPQESFQENFQKDSGDIKELEKQNRPKAVENKTGGMPGGGQTPSMYDLLQQFATQGTDESDLF